MSTSINKYNDVAVLTIKDDLTGDALEGFNRRTEECIDEGCHNIVIDCADVTTIDSGGLEALSDLQDKCEREFGAVKLCGLDEILTKILEITRLLRRFEVLPDVDAAVRSFS